MWNLLLYPVDLEAREGLQSKAIWNHLTSTDDAVRIPCLDGNAFEETMF